MYKCTPKTWLSVNSIEKTNNSTKKSTKFWTIIANRQTLINMKATGYREGPQKSFGKTSSHTFSTQARSQLQSYICYLYICHMHTCTHTYIYDIYTYTIQASPLECSKAAQKSRKVIQMPGPITEVKQLSLNVSSAPWRDATDTL